MESQGSAGGAAAVLVPVLWAGAVPGNAPERHLPPVPEPQAAEGETGPVTLYEISQEYQKEAEALHQRLGKLRRERRSCPEEQRFYLDRRIAVLDRIYRQTRELALYLEHYYERGYSRNEKYKL